MSVKKQRGGLTIVELLVCVFIIGLLMAIVVPAVQSAREAGRRAQCESQLSQIGRALHTFQESRSHFPSALAPLPNKNPKGSDRFYAPHVYLLPFVEQAPLFGNFNVQTTQFFVADPASLGQPANSPIATFLCPSDSGAAGTNYRVCLGPGPYCLWQSTLAPGGGLGAFSALYEFRPADFRDGLANTVAASEKLKSAGAQGAYSPEMFWYTSVSLFGLPLPGLDAAVSICAGLSGAPADFFPHVGETWFIAGYEYTWYNHTVAPNATTSDCSMDSPGPPGTSGGVFKASSRHPGGVNCLFMDGHVKFMSDSIDLRIFARAGDTGGWRSVE